MLSLKSSPLIHNQSQIHRVMLPVFAACLPGVAVMTICVGWHCFLNVILCTTTAMVIEAIVLLLRGRRVLHHLKDGSAAVTGILLGIALPPLLPYWTQLIAVFFAIVIAKQLYGGIGQNPFNPAMVGYALVLVSFPALMTTNWVNPQQVAPSAHEAADNLRPPGTLVITAVDSLSGATPLDDFKQTQKNRTPHAEMESTTHPETSHPETSHPESSMPQWQELFSHSGYAWQWTNLAFLFGGLLLLYWRIIRWSAPLGFLLGLAVPAVGEALSHQSVTPLLLHLFSGSTMLAAFFIITDPASGPASHLGKLIFGLLAGIIVYIIRSWGGYPDGTAFAVLFVNFAAPVLDYYTEPRTYGHKRARRGIR